MGLGLASDDDASLLYSRHGLDRIGSDRSRQRLVKCWGELASGLVRGRGSGVRIV